MTKIFNEIAFGFARGFGIYFFERKEFSVPVAAPDLHRTNSN